MAKPGNNKKNKRSSKRKRDRGKRPTVSIMQIIVAIAIVAAIILVSVMPNLNEKSPQKSSAGSEPGFKKEGELTIFKKGSNQEVRTIDIEIAETANDRARGLMYRQSMGDTVGMLFIMEREEPQAFWMKNTYISLDIIYLNKDLKIVKIQDYTQPLSEETIPSNRAAKYVLEVVAGFCDRFAIKKGDYVTYTRQPASPVGWNQMK